MSTTFPTDIQNDAKLSRLGSTNQVQSGNIPDLDLALNNQVGTDVATNYRNISNLLSQNMTQEANRSFFSNDSLASTVKNTQLTYQPINPITLNPADYPNLNPSQLASMQQEINTRISELNQQQALLLQRFNTLREQRLQENLDSLAVTQKLFSVLGGIDPLRSGRNIASLTGNQAKVRNDIINLFNEALNKQIEINLNANKLNIAGLQAAIDAEQKQNQINFQQSMALTDRLGTFVDQEGNLKEIAGQVNVPTLQGRESNRQDQELLMRRQQQIAELFGFVPTIDGQVQYLRPDGLPTTNPAEAKKNEYGLPQLFSSEPELLKRDLAKQELQMNNIKLKYAPYQQELALEQGLANLNLSKLQLKELKERIKQALIQNSQPVENAKKAVEIVNNLGTNPINGKQLNNPVYANIEYSFDKNGNITGIKKVDMADNWRDILLRNGISLSDLENDNALIRKYSKGTDASPVFENISKFVSSTDGQNALSKITFTGQLENIENNFIAIKNDTGGYRIFAIPENGIFKDDLKITDMIKQVKNDSELLSLLEQATKEDKSNVKEINAKEFFNKFIESKDAGIETKQGILQMIIGGIANRDLLSLINENPEIYKEVNNIFKNPTKALDKTTAVNTYKDYLENRIKTDYPNLNDEELSVIKDDINMLFSIFNSYKEQIKNSYGNARQNEAKEWFIATLGSLLGDIINPNYILAETIWNANIPAKTVNKK